MFLAAAGGLQVWRGYHAGFLCDGMELRDDAPGGADVYKGRPTGRSCADRLNRMAG